MPQDALLQAVERLSRAGDRMVLGGSDDGGYYLIGMKRLHHRLFEQIDWSTERVFEQTLERAREIGVRTELLPTWYDVDDSTTLERLRRELAAPSGACYAGAGYDAKHTRAYLQSLHVAQGSFSASSTC
jgi:hypothetical protein